jgi:hypothetical protein
MSKAAILIRRGVGRDHPRHLGRIERLDQVALEAGGFAAQTVGRGLILGSILPRAPR